MMKNKSYIKWDDKIFQTDHNVLSPKNSTLGILSEIEIALQLFKSKFPILDLCCGIGSIGISIMLNNPNIISKFFGFDNDSDSINICTQNIQLHKINGTANLWNAGENLPITNKGIAICNSPFLPKSKVIETSIKQSLISCDNGGLEVLFQCFHSIRGTGHIFIIKSLKSQVPKIITEVGDVFSLKRQINQKIEKDYNIAFTTWIEKNG